MKRQREKIAYEHEFNEMNLEMEKMLEQMDQSCFEQNIAGQCDLQFDGMSEFMAQEECEGYSQKSFVFPLEFLYQNQDPAHHALPPHPQFENPGAAADETENEFHAR